MRRAVHCLTTLMEGSLVSSSAVFLYDGPQRRCQSTSLNATPISSQGADSSLTSSSSLTPTIYRKEIAEGGNVRSFPLSTDISQKQFTDFFNDFDGKRCRLCGESYLQWHSYRGAFHTAREAIALKWCAHSVGRQSNYQMWWNRLHISKSSAAFHSSAMKMHTSEATVYILTFLRDKKVLRGCFNVLQGTNPKDTSGMIFNGRSWSLSGSSGWVTML